MHILGIPNASLEKSAKFAEGIYGETPGEITKLLFEEFPEDFFTKISG